MGWKRKTPAELSPDILMIREFLLRRADWLERDYWGTDQAAKGNVALLLALAEWDAGDWIHAQMAAAAGIEPLHG